MQELTDALNAGVSYATPSSAGGLMASVDAAAAQEKTVENPENQKNKYAYFLGKFKDDGNGVE